MIKRTKYCKIITAAALIICLTFLQSKIHAGSPPAGSSPAAPLISSANNEKPQKQSSNPELLPGSPWVMESLPQIKTKKRGTWVNNLLFGTDGKSMTDSAKEDLVKKRLIHSALEIAEKTEIGKTMKQLEDSVSRYLRFKYFKAFNEEIVPGPESENESDTNEKGYGITFSPKLDVGSIDNPGVKADFTYSGTIVSTEYELQNDMKAIEFSNSTLNKHLDATASFGVAESDSETSLVFKFNFDF